MMQEPLSIPPADTAAPRRERRPELDVLRILAMAGVVMIHTLSWAMGANGVPKLHPVYLAMGRFGNAVCVPAFLFLTGFLIWAGGPIDDWRAWWRRRLGVVFVPYVAWSLFYYWIRPSLYPDFTWPGRKLFIIRDIVVRLLTGTAFYHLWFPPILLAVYVLTPLARRLLAAWPPLVPLAALALQGALIVLVQNVPMAPELKQLLSQFLSLVPFAAIGAWYATVERSRPLPLWALVPAGLAGFGLLVARSTGVLDYQMGRLEGYLWRLALLAAVSAFVAMLAALLTNARPALLRHRHGIAHVAGLSYGVYLAHPLAVWGAALLILATLGKPAWANPAVLLAAYVAEVAATLGFVALLRKSRVTAWLV
jgi:surface polysaccharide O-acyltransferase-like enzyme